jgi:2-aminobenzoate-CoA ligase
MPPAAILVQRRIEWSDTDASGYYHNSAAFRMFEWAETALLESLGFLDDVYGRLPRVHITAEFKRALAHRDLVDIDLVVARVGNSSITYDIEIRRAEELCVSAQVVAVLLDEGRLPRRWPDSYRDALLSAGRRPPELLVSDNVEAS